MRNLKRLLFIALSGAFFFVTIVLADSKSAFVVDYYDFFNSQPAYSQVNGSTKNIGQELIGGETLGQYRTNPPRFDKFDKIFARMRVFYDDNPNSCNDPYSFVEEKTSKMVGHVAGSRLYHSSGLAQWIHVGKPLNRYEFVTRHRATNGALPANIYNNGIDQAIFFTSYSGLYSYRNAFRGQIGCWALASPYLSEGVD